MYLSFYYQNIKVNSESYWKHLQSLYLICLDIRDPPNMINELSQNFYQSIKLLLERKPTYMIVKHLYNKIYYKVKDC